MNTSKYNPAYIHLLVFIFPMIVMCSCHSSQNRSQARQNKKGDFSLIKSRTGKKKTILPDSTYATLQPNSMLKIPDSFKQKRTLYIDGEVSFKVLPENNTRPFVLHTGMLDLITHGAIFHVDAHQKSPGQSVKLLRGKMKAIKSYPSDYPDTEILHAGEMVMINKDIDLMEKETFDTMNFK